MTVFDENGHVELDGPDTMLAVLRELAEDPDSKWERGGITAAMQDNQLAYGLEVNPKTGVHAAVQPIVAFKGYHLKRLGPAGFGVILTMTPDQYAEFLAEQG